MTPRIKSLNELILEHHFSHNRLKVAIPYSEEFKVAQEQLRVVADTYAAIRKSLSKNIR